MAKEVSGKKVVIYSILLFIVFSAVMGFGTYEFANWLGPILRQKNEKAAKEARAANAPSPTSSSSRE